MLFRSGIELPKTAVALDSLKLKSTIQQPVSLNEEKADSLKTVSPQGVAKQMNQIVLNQEPAKLDKNPSFLGFLFDFIKGFFSIFRRK